MAVKSAMLEIQRDEIQDYEALKILKAKNPAYEAARRFSRYPTYLPEYLEFFKSTVNGFLVPRNFNNGFFKGGITDNTSLGHEIPEQNKIVLRDYQETFIQDQFLKPFRDGLTDFLINITTGLGKTVLALYIASLYRRNVLFVVNNKDLGDQALDKVREFCPNWTCNWLSLKDKKVYDFTVTTVQLLTGTKKDHFREAQTAEFYSNFGHIILDEAHHFASDRFKLVLENAVCKYRTSLTATFRRTDGLDKQLFYHLGEKLVYKVPAKSAYWMPFDTEIKINQNNYREYTSKATGYSFLRRGEQVLIKERGKEDVHGTIQGSAYVDNGRKYVEACVNYDSFTCEHGTHRIFPRGQVSMPLMENDLAENEDLHRKVLKLAKRSYDNGRKTIILSARKSFIYTLYEKFKAEGITPGVVVSKKSKEQREFCKKLGQTVKEHMEFCQKEAKIILGINQLAKEGMDLEQMDTLIIVFPMKDIEQSVGRITRIFQGKQPRLVYYFRYKCSIYTNMFKKVEKQFKELGFLRLRESKEKDINLKKVY